MDKHEDNMDTPKTPVDWDQFVEEPDIIVLGTGSHKPMTVRQLKEGICATLHHLGGASYGVSGGLIFNKMRLGNKWFERGINEEVDALLIHEFGHEYCGDHLSEEYYEALCILGARLKRLALDKPELFKPFTTSTAEPDGEIAAEMAVAQ
jgi:hypothetical protein